MERQALYGFNPMEPLSIFREDRLLAITAVRLWYCYYGRNAWNTTWITRYQDGCMNISEEAAEAFAETLRNFGNVIYIKELPALQFVGRQCSLVVTQINTQAPLRDYSLKALRVERGEGDRDGHFAFGASLEGVTRSFARGSRFWKATPPARNSVVTLYMGNTVKLSSLSAGEPLVAWQSISDGPEHYLGWQEVPNRTGKASVLRLARQAQLNTVAANPESRLQKQPAKAHLSLVKSALD